MQTSTRKPLKRRLIFAGVVVLVGGVLCWVNLRLRDALRPDDWPGKWVHQVDSVTAYYDFFGEPPKRDRNEPPGPEYWTD